MKKNMREFLEYLYPKFYKSNNVINIKGFHRFDKDKRKIKTRFFKNLNKAIEYTEEIDKDNNYQAFFVCAELNPGSKNASEKNIDSFNFLYADIDPHVKDSSRKIVKTYTKEELMHKIKSFKMPPTLIVDSGRGYHMYWKLDKATKDIELVKALVREIQVGLDSDENATKATQLLRIAGTNNKKDEIAKVKIIEKTEKTYTIDEICKILDVDKDNIKKEMKQKIKGTRVKDTKIVNCQDVKFDFTKEIEPLNLIADSHDELLDIIKKQNILSLTDLPLDSLGQNFCCCYHDDSNPSANIFKDSDGYYRYHCFGCKISLDIIGIYMVQNPKIKDSYEALVKLACIFGIKGKYIDWAKKKYMKYDNNKDILGNWKFRDYKEDYPNLSKILNNRTHYLFCMNEHGEQNIRNEKYIYSDENLFFLSAEHFAKKFSNENRVTETTAKRLFNLFCLLGLIKKVPLIRLNKEIQEEAEEYVANTGIKNQNHSNFYIIYDFRDKVEEAEIIAEKLIESKFKIGTCMNKGFIILHFGQKVADEIYPDGRVISKRNKTIANKLEATLAKSISNKGYATRNEIVKRKIIYNKEKVTENKKRDELDKNIKIFLDKYNLEEIRANDKLVKKFDLKGRINIIIPKSS